MTTQTAKEVAHRYAEGAITNFKKDGHLVPTMIVVGDQFLSMSFNAEASENIQEAILDSLGIVLCSLDADPDWVVMVMEGWLKRVELPKGVTEADVEAEMGAVRHGDFQREVEAGAHLDTGLVITCWNVADPDASHGLIYTVEQDFACEEMPGPQGGGVDDVVRACIATGRKARPHRPPEYTLAMAALACQQWVEVFALGLTKDQAAEDFGFPPQDGEG